MKRALCLLALLLAGCATPAPAPPTDTGPATMPTPTDAIPRPPIVAFGDSYTEGFGATRDEAYPAVLSRALGREVLNKGVTGETAEEAMRRIERDVLRNDPDVVILEFGVNEAYRGYPPARAAAGIERLVELVRNDTGAEVVIVGVHFAEYGESFDDLLRGVAWRHDADLVLDVLDGIVAAEADGEQGDASLRHDAYHPNARGYALMAERIRPAVEAALERRARS